jgi:acyl-CoA thioesterase-2
VTESVLSGQIVVDALLALLDLRRIADDRFVGVSPPVGPQRIFGGQVAAQALVAAGRSVDADRTVHSLHGYFVRAGDPTEPIEFRVENIRDGRSFSVRRCVAYQHDKAIFTMSSSFHRAESGLEHQTMPPDVPTPDETPTMVQLLSPYPERVRAWLATPRPLDIRYVTEPGWLRPGDRAANEHHRAWMRIDGKLPDDPLMHACALAFASDITLLDAILSVHGEVWGKGGMVGASLDHALWFHRPFRADEWFLYDCWSPSASAARGLASGHMFTAGGRHIATAVQEGLLRRVGG